MGSSPTWATWVSSLVFYKRASSSMEESDGFLGRKVVSSSLTEPTSGLFVQWIGHETSNLIIEVRIL